MLRRNARECGDLLRRFDVPIAYELWNNPIVNAANQTQTLGSAGRTSDASVLHGASGGVRLCDDGVSLVNGGLTDSGRLWLLYDYHCLTDFEGNDSYTIVRVLRTARFDADDRLSFTLGYDWQSGEWPGRPGFERDERWIRRHLLRDDRWRTVHLIHDVKLQSDSSERRERRGTDR